MFERMLNKDEVPSFDGLIDFCGENGEKFSAVNSFLSENFLTSQEIRFPYGKSYGWCITHRKAKKLICDIFAENGAFCVMLRLSDKQFFSLYPELSDYTKKYIDSRYPCGDGGWIHYRVTDSEQLSDIEKLLSQKCKGAKGD